MHPPTYTLQAARLAEPRIKALGLEMGFAAIDATSPGTCLCVCASVRSRLDNRNQTSSGTHNGATTDRRRPSFPKLNRPPDSPQK